MRGSGCGLQDATVKRQWPLNFQPSNHIYISHRTPRTEQREPLTFPLPPAKWSRPGRPLLRLRGPAIYHDTNEHEIGQGLLNFPFKMFTCRGSR